jgi:hypothetical protein
MACLVSSLPMDGSASKVEPFSCELAFAKIYTLCYSLARREARTGPVQVPTVVGSSFFLLLERAPFDFVDPKPGAIPQKGGSARAEL